MSAYSSKTLVALTLISILLGVAIGEMTPLGLRVYSPEGRLGGDQPVIPVFHIDITPSNISIRQGESGNLTVTLIDLPYLAESAITSETAIFLHINLNPYPSFTGILPEGVTATLNPSSVILQPNGEANSTLMLKVDSVAPTGTYFITVGGAWRWGEDRTSYTGTSLNLTVYGNNPPLPHHVHELKAKMVLIPGVYLDTPNTVNVCSRNYIGVLVWNFGSSREEDVTVQIFVDGVKVREQILALTGYPETYDMNRLADTRCVVSKRWVPISVKTYNITTVVFNPYNYVQDSREVTVIGTQPLYLLTTLPLIILTLLLGGGTLAIIWVILLRRRMKIEDSHL